MFVFLYIYINDLKGKIVVFRGVIQYMARRTLHNAHIRELAHDDDDDGNDTQIQLSLVLLIVKSMMIRCDEHTHTT